jgi:chemotaxis family two-component system sensor kinase Cph1
MGRSYVDDDNLRKWAEERLKNKNLLRQTNSETDLRALVNELEVHQIELEMQNEELQRAKLELEESELKYRDLYEFAPVGYITFDATGTIREINLAGASLIGTTRNNLINRRLQLFLAPGSGTQFDEFCASALKSDTRQTCEVHLGNRAQVHKSVRIEGQAIENNSGSIAVFRAFLLDVTEQRQLEEEAIASTKNLERSNLELEQFAYVASHDLKEPLRMVTSFSQLLAQRYRGKLDPDADEFIGYIVEGAHRMDALINDLLDFSRVASQRKPFAPTDMNRVVEKVIHDLSVTIREKGAEVEVGPLPTVMADNSQMTQLFQNLIANAIKFHGNDPIRIEIRAEKLDDEYKFSVRDNGIGIPQEYFEKIFVIFQRLHTSEKYVGTGIGLAICRRIVERHGGRIWAESEVGQGSTFFFTIPY